MKIVKEFICDGDVPSDEEILECIEIAKREDCAIKLKWFGSYSGWHKLLLYKGMTLETCKGVLKKYY